MQLKNKLSLLVCSLLAASSAMAEDYVSVQFVQYDESDNRASISSPSIELSKDFGVDYNLKVALTSDSVSGASPTWHDSVSSASGHTRSEDVNKNEVSYGALNYDDDRESIGATLTTRFASRDELVVGVNYSKEADYEAREISSEYMHFLDSSKNQSLSLGISYQSNRVEVPCYENSMCDSASGASELFDVDVVSAELGFSQVIDETSLVKVSVFTSNEDGYLSNPYMNVVRQENLNSDIVNVLPEEKPDKRISYGSTLQYTKALSENLASNNTYRFYTDDWGIQSHTLSSELYYELGQDWILGAGLRYYMQSEADFYHDAYFGSEGVASSDERMSEFNAIGYKLSADYKVSQDLSLNAGLNFYNQDNNFDATYYNIGLKYRF